MSIANDWDVNYSGKVISHIDGVLSYDGGSGTQPAVGKMILGATSGCVGKVLSVTGNATAGTLTLTNVVHPPGAPAKFTDGEVLSILAEQLFDGVGNGGFAIGDVLVDQVTGTITVKFIEYNIDGVAGHGKIFGTARVAFTNDSVIDISGGTAAVAVADGTGTAAVTFAADVNGTLAVPGTANTNNCVILHYDAGTVAIPEDAHITSISNGAEGYAQAVIGAVATGSVRVVDSDTTGGAWTDGDAVRILDVEYYDTLVAGKVFSVGQVVKGLVSGYRARVIAVVEDSGTTGKLVFAGNTGTPWTDTEAIQVLQSDDTYVTYANVDAGQNSYLDVATFNIPAGARLKQRADQGGIFGDAVSLNVKRSFNALYSYLVDLFEELGALDDLPPMEGNVKDQLYTVLNDYIIPDLSFRFLEKGSCTDSGGNNIYANFQTAGVIADIGDNAYFYDTVNPRPQPDLYLEQDGVVQRRDWLEGHVDQLIKVKTSTDPKYINSAVEALGQLIDGGTVVWHLRPFGRTYDFSEVTVPSGGQVPVFLANAPDLNNTTAQYSCTYASGTGQLLAGEEALTSGGKRVIIVSCGAGATGTVTWQQKSTTNLVDTDVITGSVTGFAVTLNTVPTAVVAGYDSDIRVMVVQRRFTGGTTTVANYILGELVTQSGTAATGYFMEDDGGTIYIEEQSGTFNGTGLLTGGISGALNTPTGTALYSTVPKDIGGGVGDKNYTCVVSADITGQPPTDPQSALQVYEWWKYITRSESTYQVNTPGSIFSVYTLGKLFRKLQPTFKEVRGAGVFGTKAGALVIGAQGVFIEKFTLTSGDIRNIQLIDNLGGTYDPPNLQVLRMSNIVAGVRAAVYRSTGVGSETILRNEFKVGVVGAGNNEAADSTVLVAANNRTVSPLPNDVPDEGVLRILSPNDTGNYIMMPYISVDRVTNIFTLGGTIGSYLVAAGETSGPLVLDDNVHVAFFEEEAATTYVETTIQYVASIPLYAVARVKGKQPFKTTTAFGTGGANIGAVLNADKVVNLP